jgi:hypothetical protein
MGRFSYEIGVCRGIVPAGFLLVRQSYNSYHV